VRRQPAGLWPLDLAAPKPVRRRTAYRSRRGRERHRLLRRLLGDEGGQEPLGRDADVRGGLCLAGLEAGAVVHGGAVAGGETGAACADRGGREAGGDGGPEGGRRLVEGRTGVSPEVRLRRGDGDRGEQAAD